MAVHACNSEQSTSFAYKMCYLPLIVGSSHPPILLAITLLLTLMGGARACLAKSQFTSEELELMLMSAQQEQPHDDHFDEARFVERELKRIVQLDDPIDEMLTATKDVLPVVGDTKPVPSAVAATTVDEQYDPSLECEHTIGDCSWYDRRFQAHSVAEAMAYFPDLIDLDHLTHAAAGVNHITHQCRNDHCVACVRAILRQIQRQGPWLDREEQNWLLKKFLADKMPTQVCDKLNPKTPLPTRRRQIHQQIIRHEVEQCIFGNSSTKPDPHVRSSRTRLRWPRSATEQDKYPGELVIMRCVPAGFQNAATRNNSKSVHMCTRCWAIRRLPEGYTPRLINEVVCGNANATSRIDPKDEQKCISGFGVCTEREHVLTFWHRDSTTGDVMPVQLPTRTCCQCRIWRTSGALTELMRTHQQQLIDGTTNITTTQSMTDANATDTTVELATSAAPIDPENILLPFLELWFNRTKSDNTTTSTIDSELKN